MPSSDLESVPRGIGRKRATLRHLRLYARGFGQHGVDIGRAIAPDDRHAVDISRSSMTETAILLPPSAYAPDSILLADAMVAHAVGHLRFSEPGSPVGKRVPLMIAMLSLIEDERIERLMIREYPGLRQLWGRFRRTGEQLQSMHLTFATLAARLSLALHDPDYRDTHYWVEKGRAMIEGIGSNLEAPIRFREVASILANDLGQMRVPFDAGSYQVEPEYRDDNTYLWRFENDEAVSAVVEAHGSKAQRTTEEAWKLQDSADEADCEAITLMYPEWNYKANVLRDDWVGVVEGLPLEMNGSDGVLHEGAKPLRSAQIHYKQMHSFRRVRHQAEGDEIDIEALVTHVVARRSGKEPDGRIFTRAGRRVRDASILVLLDLSRSTSRAVDAESRTLLDCERGAAHAIVTAFDGEHVRIALHGFSSNGRAEVRYVRFKDFGDGFQEWHRRRLQAVEPAWSTRIGAALRHAGTCLEPEKSPSKTILLITDGEPSDIDVFDPHYLVADARHAVNGLAMQGVHVQCVSVDPCAHEAICEIFGWRSAYSLARSTRLHDVLPNLLSKLVA